MTAEDAEKFIKNLDSPIGGQAVDDDNFDDSISQIKKR